MVRLIKDTGFILGKSLLVKALSLPVTIVTAQILGPSLFGILKILDFIPMLSKYGNPDLSSLVLRNASNYERIDKKCEFRDTAYTFSIFCYFILFFICITISLLLFEKYIIEIIIASFSIFTIGFNKILSVNLKLEKKFKYIAIGQSYEVIIKSAFILILIHSIDLYANLLGVLLGSLVLVFYNLTNTKPYFKLNISKDILLNQLKVGIPLALTTLSLGLELFVERFFIVKIFGLEDFGRYIFLIILINSIGLFINNFLQVYSVEIYKKMSNPESQCENIIQLPTFITCALFPFILVFLIIVSYFINKYSGKYFYSELDILFCSLILFSQFVPAFISTGALSNSINGQFYILVFRCLSIVGFSVTFMTLDFLNIDPSFINIFLIKLIFTFLFTALVLLIFYKKMMELKFFVFAIYFLCPSLFILLLYYISTINKSILNITSLLIISIIFFLYYKSIIKIKEFK